MVRELCTGYLGSVWFQIQPCVALRTARQSVHDSIFYVTLSLFVSLSLCPSLSLSVCLFVCLSVCLSRRFRSIWFSLAASISIIVIIHLSLNREGRLVHHRWFHNQFPPFSSVFYCPQGLGEFQVCPFPGVVFPPLPPSVLSFPPFTMPCKMVLVRPDERETCPYNCSLRLFKVVRRLSCSTISRWQLSLLLS